MFFLSCYSQKICTVKTVWMCVCLQSVLCFLISQTPSNFPSSCLTPLIKERQSVYRNSSSTCPLTLGSAARLSVSADVQLLLTAGDLRPVIKWINWKQFPAFWPIIGSAIFSFSLEHNYRASAVAFNFTRRSSKTGYDLICCSIWLICMVSKKHDEVRLSWQLCVGGSHIISDQIFLLVYTTTNMFLLCLSNIKSLRQKATITWSLIYF